MSDAPPSDRSPHLDLDALADVVADEAGPADTAHLGGCAPCTSRLQELRAADVRVLDALTALPAPELPADLADRMSAAVAAEPTPGAAGGAGGAGAPAGQPPVRAASVSALPFPAGRARRSWLPAAAAAVLLASGAGLGFTLLQDRGASESHSDTAATAGGAESLPADLAIPLSASGADWSAPDAASTALPQVLSGQAPQVALQEGARGGAGETEDAVSPLAEDGLSALRTPEGLAGCLQSVLPPEESDLVPLAVDYATYAGQPALAVVLPDPDPAQVSVFVVGAGCSAADDRTLFFLRAPRP